jgi:restriction system protein
MGAIYFSRSELIGQTSELVGYKSGLALTQEKAATMLDEDTRSYWLGPLDTGLRIRSEEYESLYLQLLNGVGRIPWSPTKWTPSGLLYRKWHTEKPELLRRIALKVAMLSGLVHMRLRDFDEGSREIVKLIAELRTEHGVEASQMAEQLIPALEEEARWSPWVNSRPITWGDVKALDELFSSELLGAQAGQYVDQRFVDYLANNFPEIDNMNWRKFEGLTADWFTREGYKVELGPGRDDDGVDLRVWPQEAQPNACPAILVQCKRYASKISKAVVKSLHADIQYYQAGSGLIVTTSALSPGAKKTINCRSYLVDEADRTTLRAWIEAMRTPGTGAFLAE